jgi:hypothetical protein
MFNSISKVQDCLQKEVNLKDGLLIQSLESRVQGPLTPSGTDYDLNLHEYKTDKDLIGLAVLSWCFPDTGGLIRVGLENRHCNSPENEVNFRLLLFSKEVAETVLNGLFSDRDLFGNWIPRMRKLISKLDFKESNTGRPKRILRRRGYRDHGTLRPSSEWLPSSDYSLTEMQQRIEERRDFFRNLPWLQFTLLRRRLKKESIPLLSWSKGTERAV